LTWLEIVKPYRLTLRRGEVKARSGINMLVSIRDVRARWAYTEIVQSHSSSYYDRIPGINALRDRRTNSAPFDELSESERNSLSSACEDVREFFTQYLKNVRAYLVEQWKTGQLLRVRVPPAVAREYPDYPALADFIFTPCGDGADPRNAHEETTFRNSGNDSLTLGFHNSDYVLGDGFHRCKQFIMSAAPEETIPVFVPVK
jgi:hypothetical protein